MMMNDERYVTLCFLDVRDKIPIILLFEQRYLLRYGLVFHGHIILCCHILSLQGVFRG